jgi:hypothetical protein
MEPVGGYFELADRCENGVFPHRNGLLLNTGRNAFEYILRSLGEVRCVYLPYYTCEVVLEPLNKLSIPWSFYSIDQDFEMTEKIVLGENEYLVANNYFGIKDAYIRTLASTFGDRLIVDCAQAFFAGPIPGIKAFYSCRKFVGVADGGVAYADLPLDTMEFPEDITSDHDSHLYIRKESGAEAGFKEFQENEKKLDNQPILSMSGKTKEILEHVDYAMIVARRKANWQYLHDRLKDRNLLSLPEPGCFGCPMVYPFLVPDGEIVRRRLIEKKVFVARYWPNVTDDGIHATECMLRDQCVCLPCDQRYEEDDMKRIVDILRAE